MNFQGMSDSQLQDAIERYKGTYDLLACNLPDRGEKVVKIIRRIKEEQNCRRIVNVDRQVDRIVNVDRQVDPATITRPGFGDSGRGRSIQLEANYFKLVCVKSQAEIVYQYSVLIFYEDNKAVVNNGIRRKPVNHKLYQTCASDEPGGTKFAYDGEKALYTVWPFLQTKQVSFTVVLEESLVKRGSLSGEGSPSEPAKRSKRSLHSKSYKVVINYVTEIPLKSVLLAVKGAETEKFQDALRVLDTILRRAANRGCLLVRQSFFDDDSRMVTDVGGGVASCRGLHSSFRPTHDGVSLNIDVSTTMIIPPGPVIEFLKAYKNATNARPFDWAKVKEMLINMRVKATHNNREFKIIGLSDKPCNKLYFTLKRKSGDGTNGDGQPKEISVFEYFTSHLNLKLTKSAALPCLDVGKPKKPIYLPLELCSLVHLQRYTKALSSEQRAVLVENSRQKPLERKEVLTLSMNNFHYDEDPLLSACGISIEKQLTKFDGRVLNAPMLKVGDNQDCIPQNGRWNFHKKTFHNPIEITRWAIVIFSTHNESDIFSLHMRLSMLGKRKGMVISRQLAYFKEENQYRSASSLVRVKKMFEQIQETIPPNQLQFLLCILPKNCDLYGPWKKECLVLWGIATQCISPPTKINNKYLTDVLINNVLLKINTKLGGTNSLLAAEVVSDIPMIKDTPTMILGMDVSHGAPGRTDVPSIAAVVGSHSWPLISRYGAAFRTQSSKVEMIESLFKLSPRKDSDEMRDTGIMRELLLKFCKKNNGEKPSQIVVFRDGVSESQFSNVLNNELDQMIKACEHFGYKEEDRPKFTVIVAQKNHHTKLFKAGSVNENVPPGTVVDTEIVHPRKYDFYMCAQEGKIGTSRPAHYHVLVDEIGFTPDDLQKLIHSLSYVYQRSTTAISIVAPIRYAHLAATQVTHFLEFADDTSSGSVPIPKLRRLHDAVAGSMFFC